MSNPSPRIDEIMNSLDGMSRAEAPPYLWSKVRNRLTPSSSILKPRLAWMAAAMMVFLLLNVITLRHQRSPQVQTGSGSQSVANEYSISLPQTY